MQKHIIFFIFLLSVSNIFGQELKISNGEEEKILNTNGVYEIVIGNGDISANDEFCNCSTLTGKIVSFTKDSLRLDLTHVYSYQLVDKVAFQNSFVAKNNTITSTIAKSDIQRMKYFKSAKNKNRKEGVLLGLGGVLLTTGVITAANTFLVSDKSSKKNLWISSGIQFSIGATLLSFTGTRKYNFKEKEKPWKFY